MAWHRVLFVAMVMALSVAARQPTTDCHVRTAATTAEGEVSFIEVNGKRLASIVVTNIPSFVAVFIGHNCLPITWAHIFYDIDDIAAAYHRAPRGTIMAVISNNMHRESMTAESRRQHAILMHYFRVQENSLDELFYGISAYEEENGFPSMGSGAICHVTRKGYPAQSQTRTIVAYESSRVTDFVVSTESGCISPLPSPRLVAPPLGDHANLLQAQIAFYDRLWCGATVYGWEYVPSARGQVYFGIWSVREKRRGQQQAYLRGSTQVDTAGHSEQVRYVCLPQSERIEARFGDTYGIHYPDHEPGHLPSDRKPVIQTLDCDGQGALFCKQSQAFPCGRAPFVGDVDMVAVATVTHEQLLDSDAVTEISYMMNRTMGVRPILDAEFVYTCGCHDDGDCQRAGDVYMVCDEGQCRCRERYVYQRHDNRCGTDLAHGKHVWQRSTLNGVYGADLAVDSLDDTCSYTDPYDTTVQTSRRRRRPSKRKRRETDASEQTRHVQKRSSENPDERGGSSRPGLFGMPMQQWLAYIEFNQTNTKTLRAPWFVLDLGYEAMVQSVTITPPATLDDYLRLRVGGRELLLRSGYDGQDPSSFLGDTITHVYRKGFSYWLLYEQPDYQGPVTMIGPDAHDDIEHQVTTEHYVGVMRDVRSVRNIVDKVGCIKHRETGLFFGVGEHGQVIMEQRCEAYFYYDTSSNILYHAQSHRPLAVDRRVTRIGLKLSTSAVDVAVFNMRRASPDTSFHVYWHGANDSRRLCLTSDGEHGSAVEFRAEECSFWTVQPALSHIHRLQKAGTETLMTNARGYATLDISESRRSEGTSCVLVTAVDGDGQHVQTVQINGLVDIYSGRPNAVLHATYSMSEPTSASPERFEVLVTSELGEHNVPVSSSRTLCTRYSGSLREGATTTINCDKILRGRYVAITKYALTDSYRPNMLSMCDLQIHGHPVSIHGSDCRDHEECQVQGDPHLQCGADRRCHCCQGFYYPGKNADMCADVDECLTAHCEYKCVNERGSYHCECPDDHTLSEDGFSCIAGDPCMKGKHRCDHHCHHQRATAGGGEQRSSTYFCSCDRGYHLQRDEHSCEDDDECTQGTNDCTSDMLAECVNTLGSHTCRCPYRQYGVEWDGSRCIKPGAKSFCDIHNGLCEHRCHDDGSGFFDTHCSCEDGYVIAEDDKSCHAEGLCEGAANGGCDHRCSDEGDTVLCHCYSGYHLLADQRTCHDTDECKSDNGHCADTCVNTPGSYQCLCFDAIPIAAGKGCIVGSRVVVYQVEMSGGIWTELLLDIRSTYSQKLASLITTQLRHGIHGDLSHARIEVIDFFPTQHGNVIGVRLGAIFIKSLETGIRADVMISLLSAIKQLTVTTSERSQLDVKSSTIRYVESSRGLGPTHALHSSCDVYTLLRLCHNGATCNEVNGQPTCICPDDLEGPRCEQRTPRFDTLGDNHFALLMGGIGVLVVVVLLVVLIACCCCLGPCSTRKRPVHAVLATNMLNSYAAPSLNPYATYSQCAADSVLDEKPERTSEPKEEYITYAVNL